MPNPGPPSASRAWDGKFSVKSLLQKGKVSGVLSSPGHCCTHLLAHMCREKLVQCRAMVGSEHSWFVIQLCHLCQNAQLLWSCLEGWQDCPHYLDIEGIWMRCSGESPMLLGKDRFLQMVLWNEGVAEVSDLSCGELQCLWWLCRSSQFTLEAWHWAYFFVFPLIRTREILP